jgi:hypothetical protein
VLRLAVICLLVFGAALRAAAPGPAVPIEPFFLAKLSPTGAYNPKDFAVLWSAFRQQYRVGVDGSLIQQGYARELIRKVETNSPFAFSEMTMLFGDNKSGKNAVMHVEGEALQKAPAKVLRTPKEAADYVLDASCRGVEMQVGKELTRKMAGAHEVLFIRKVVNEFDRTLQVPDFEGSFRNNPTVIFLTDPDVVPFGAVTAHVEPTEGGFNEVGVLADSKPNQDRFMQALKAGAGFKVFWFKEGLCYECKGSGMVPGKFDKVGKNVKSFQLSGGSLAVDEKCKTCAGSGRLPRGHVSCLVGEIYPPPSEK